MLSIYRDQITLAATLADRVLALLRDCYLDSGYLYSGCMTPQLISKWVYPDDEGLDAALEELQVRGLVQRRACHSYTFELTAPERVRLIEAHNLSRLWEEEAPFFYPNREYGEVKSAQRAEAAALHAVAA